MHSNKLASSIREQALALGYEECGIIPISDMEGYEQALEQRMEYFPDSKPMYSQLTPFARLRQSYPWAKSVVVCARWFGVYRIPEGLNGVIAKSFLFDSRKDARAKEYQGSIAFEAFLQAQNLQTAVRRDYGITALRWAAAKAGIGVIRKNNFLYTSRGSWIRLETFLVDRELELKLSPDIKKCPDNCGLCSKNCPTKSLAGPFLTNGMRCISFLNTKLGCTVGAPLFEQTGDWLYGCDTCQDVCPFNMGAWEEKESFPGIDALTPELSLENILSMDYSSLSSLLPPKFWYFPEDEVWKWKTNALNAMNNNYKEQYAPFIRMALNDADTRVRAFAKYVVEKRLSAKPNQSDGTEHM